MNPIRKLATRDAVSLELADSCGRCKGPPLGWLAIALSIVSGCAQQNIQSAYLDAVENNAAIQTDIYTKLAGTTFSLDILVGAVQNDGSITLSMNGQYFGGNGSYTTVDLVDMNKSHGSCGSIGDSNKATSSQTYYWNGSEHGRHPTSFTSAQAVANAAVRIYAYGCYPGYPCQSATGCSTDNFTIRPAYFTVSTNPASGNNQVAGATFSMTATAANSSGTVTTSYTGTPVINSGVIIDWTSAAIPASSWSGAFGAAANGVATGSSFKYGDFGQLTFPANAVYDSTYVPSSGAGDVASSDCISGSSSNTLSGGKYGCSIGATTFTTPSFVPDHYAVNYTITPVCNNKFTYLGQSFNSLAVTINAMNTSGGLLTRLTAAAPSPPSFTLAALNGGSAITNPLTLSSYVWTGGVYANGGNATTRPATPVDYETFALKTTPNDGKTVTLCNGASQAVTYCTSPTTILRYGILKLSDGIGTALLPANMQVSAQYWNGTAFVTNTDDSCTPVQFNSNTIARGNYTGNLTGINLLNSAVTLANGIGVLQVSSVGQKTGSAKIAIRLAATDNNCLGVAAPGPSGALNSLSYLGGIWCGASYSMDTSAQASFGTLKSPYIYRSEKF